MKTIRKHAKKFSVVMCLSILFMSCSSNDDALNTSSKQSRPKGEEIFKGLFFFQNDISKNLSFLNEINTTINSLDNKNDIKKSLKEMSDISVSFINKKYPTFFNELENTFYSGNQYEIEKKMSLSVSIIEQALLTSSKYSKALAVGKEIGKDKALTAKISKIDLTSEKGMSELKTLLASSSSPQLKEQMMAFAAVVAVAYVAAAAVSFVLAAYSLIVKVAYWDPTSLTSADGVKIYTENSLGHDMAINEIGSYFSSLSK